MEAKAKPVLIVARTAMEAVDTPSRKLGAAVG
jgi:hypothetical protein